MRATRRCFVAPDFGGQAGQAYTEYGLILFLIGITVIGALMLLSQHVFALWHQISTSMPH